MNLEINSRITWNSAAGQLLGTVKNITLSKNAADQVVPWIDITVDNHSVRLCATDSNLKAMQVQLVSSLVDYVEKTNIMTGKRYLERLDTPYCCSPASETFWAS
jgi:hypothetical protein